MATLDDIPTLPPAAATLSPDDMLAVIDSGNRRSPKRTTVSDLFAASGLNPVFDGLEVTGGLTFGTLTISNVSANVFTDDSDAIDNGKGVGDIYIAPTGELRVVLPA